MNRYIDIDPIEIDRSATKKAAQRALEKYQMFLLSSNEEWQPKITGNYSFEVPATRTNQIYSATENIAIENVDRQRERAEYISTIAKAVNRLKDLERAILISRYFTKTDVGDLEIYLDLGLGKTKYYSVKSQAMINLAMALNIEVYKE
jgi:ArpU family phage transcriptional regulator